MDHDDAFLASVALARLADGIEVGAHDRVPNTVRRFGGRDSGGVGVEYGLVPATSISVVAHRRLQTGRHDKVH